MPMSSYELDIFSATSEWRRSLWKRIQDQVPGEEPFIKPWMIDVADDHYQLDISRASQILGWQPRRSLRETLPKMVESLKADPSKWYRTNKLEAPGELRDHARTD